MYRHVYRVTIKQMYFWLSLCIHVFDCHSDCHSVYRCCRNSWIHLFDLIVTLIVTLYTCLIWLSLRIQLFLQHLNNTSAYSDTPGEKKIEMCLDLNIWSAFWVTAYSSQIGEGCASAHTHTQTHTHTHQKRFKKCSISPLINLKCIQIFLDNLKRHKSFKCYSNVPLIYLRHTILRYSSDTWNVFECTANQELESITYSSEIGEACALAHHKIFQILLKCTPNIFQIYLLQIERWGAGVETQKNVRGEIGGWGRVPFNEPYAPSLNTIYDGA